MKYILDIQFKVQAQMLTRENTKYILQFWCSYLKLRLNIKQYFIGGCFIFVCNVVHWSEKLEGISISFAHETM